MKKWILAIVLALPSLSFAGYNTLQDDEGNLVGVTGGALNVSGNFNVNGSTVNVNVIGTVPVSGPLTDTELRASPVPVSGTVSVGNFPATQPVSATDLDIRDLSSSQDSVSAVPEKNASAAVTAVAVSPTVATLASANAARIKLIIHNETGTLYVKLGTGATTSSYTYRLTANERIEITQYTGAVTGIKVSGNTTALVSEY